MRDPDVEHDDPNVVVLQKFEVFEDTVARLATQMNRPYMLTPSSNSIPREDSTDAVKELSELSLLEQAQNGGLDSHLLQHYRSTISHQVIQIGRTDTVEDIFEIQARTFLPVSPYFHHLSKDFYGVEI